MLDTKIQLIEEQNKLIKFLYNLFTNLESEIKKQEQEKENNDLNNKERKPQHMEYIYKELIVKFLKENSKDKGIEQSIIIEEKESQHKAKDEYTFKKKSQIQKLEQRSQYLSDYNEVSLDDLHSYEYTKCDKKDG